MKSDIARPDPLIFLNILGKYMFLKCDKDRPLTHRDLGHIIYIVFLKRSCISHEL